MKTRERKCYHNSTLSWWFSVLHEAFDCLIVLAADGIIKSLQEHLPFPGWKALEKVGQTTLCCDLLQSLEVHKSSVLHHLQPNLVHRLIWYSLSCHGSSFSCAYSWDGMNSSDFITRYSQRLSLPLQNERLCVLYIDMAGIVPGSSSFPSHPLFPILPGIISNSHEPF